MVEELTNNGFDELVSNNNIVVVDFFAEWCMPCLMMAPVIDELDQKISGMKFAKINVDDNQELARKHGVMSIPTLVIFKEGKEIDRITGALPSEVLEEKLKAHV